MKLTIRLSDEARWSSAPTAVSSAVAFREACLEAFVALRTEWASLCAEPAHRTRKHALHNATRPRALLVQVLCRGEWAALPLTPKIREPGSVPNAETAWTDENWEDAFDRCVKTHLHVLALARFAGWTAED